MYTKIVNPETNRNVSIFSKKGVEVLYNYINYNQMAGAATKTKGIDYSLILSIIDRLIHAKEKTEKSAILINDINKFTIEEIENQLDVIDLYKSELSSLIRPYPLTFQTKSKIKRRQLELTDEQYRDIDVLIEKMDAHSSIKLFIRKQKDTLLDTGICHDCGVLLNAGTYGNIFQDNTNQHVVIKGSKKGHSITHGCPPEYVKEWDMLNKVKAVFPKDLELIHMIRTHGDIFIENRKCFYKMDKIEPIVLNDRQLSIARDLLTVQKDHVIKYAIEELMRPALVMHEETVDRVRKKTYYGNIFMMVPGIDNSKLGQPPHFNEGGGENSRWREIGMEVIKQYFIILGINYHQYISELQKILHHMHSNNIILEDVEFILGQIGEYVGIFMIDFDKVKTMDPMPPLKHLIGEDMWPKDLF